MSARPAKICLTTLIVIAAFLSTYVTPISADGTGTGTVTFIVANHPPSISNATINQTGNNITLVAMIVENLDTLVDVDRVVVYVYEQGKNASMPSQKNGALGFEWSRKGSRSNPDNCSDSVGCWYEQTSTGWNRSLMVLARFSHDEVNAKTTAGVWNFSFTIESSDSSNWDYVVTVYDRSGVAATAAGIFTVACS
jgi:hypothetical protein